MDTGEETGPVICQTRVEVRATDDAATLYRRLDDAAVGMLEGRWDHLSAIVPNAQAPGGSSHRRADINNLRADGADRRALNLLRALQDDEGAIVGSGAERVRVRINGSTVLLDTAHNAQKLTALRDRALLVLPTPFTLCVAFSDAPELKIVDMVAELAAFAPERLVATEYRPGLLPTGKRAVPAEFIATLARTTGIETVLEPDPVRAAQLSQELAHGAVLITGSTFLVAQTRPGIVAAAANDPSSNGPSRATHG